MAYAFSKMQFIEEQDAKVKKNYNQMRLVEFLEFLGRLAFLIWEDQDENMDMKLWRMLEYLFDFIKEQVKGAGEGEGVSSESDYDDNHQL